MGSPNEVEAIRAANLIPIGFVALASAATALASSADGSTLYAAFGTDSLAIIDIQGFEVTQTISSRALREVSAMAVSADGSRFISRQTPQFRPSIPARSRFPGYAALRREYHGRGAGGPIYLGETGTDGSPSVLVFDRYHKA